MATDQDWSTLAKRLSWVIANCERSEKQGGGPWDDKTLSKAAGLGSSHVGQFIRGEQTNPTLGTINKIAAAADVSAAWLAYGVGSPHHDDDTRAPSSRDDASARRENVLGWDDAERAVREDAKKYSDEQWAIGRRIAALSTKGIIEPDEVRDIMRLVAKQSDPARVEKQLAEAYARQKQVLADAEERERLAREKAKAPPEPTKPRGRGKKEPKG